MENQRLVVNGAGLVMRSQYIRSQKCGVDRRRENTISHEWNRVRE